MMFWRIFRLELRVAFRHRQRKLLPLAAHLVVFERAAAVQVLNTRSPENTVCTRFLVEFLHLSAVLASLFLLPGHKFFSTGKLGFDARRHKSLQASD